MNTSFWIGFFVGVIFPGFYRYMSKKGRRFLP